MVIKKEIIIIMKYIYWICFIILGLSSCKKLETTSAIVGSFRQSVSHQSTGVTAIQFSISYDTLFKWIGAKKGKELYHSKNDKNAPFPLKMIQDGPFEIFVSSGNSIQLKVPIAWEAEPSLSGFSAGIVRGKMQIEINSKIDLSDYQNIKVSQSELNYHWIEKPSIKVLGFGVNVTGVIDQMIQSKKASILENLNHYTTKSLQFNHWEKSINDLLKPMVFQDFIFHNYHTSIDFANLSLNKNGLNGIIRIKSHIELADKLNVLAYNLPLLVRFEKIKQDSLSSIDFNLNVSYSYLKKLVIENLKNSYPNSEVNFEVNQIDSSGILCKMKGLKGKNSMLSFQLIPVIKSMNKLGVSTREIQLSQLSFPSSLLKKYIKRRINQQLNVYELDIDHKIQELLSNNNLIEPQGYQLKLNEISFNNQSVNLTGKVFGQYTLKK